MESQEHSAVFRSTFSNLCQILDLYQTQYPPHVGVDVGTLEAVRLLAGRPVLAAFRTQTAGKPAIFGLGVSDLVSHGDKSSSLPFFGNFQQQFQQEL